MKRRSIYGAIIVGLIVLLATLFTQRRAEVAGIDEFAVWVRVNYPEWREADISTIVSGVEVALQAHRGDLGDEGQALLLQATYPWLTNFFSRDSTPVPATYLLAAANYRDHVEDYVRRVPFSLQEQDRLRIQLHDLYAHAQGLWLASPVAGEAAAGAMMEAIQKGWLSRMDSPLSRYFKRAFTEHEVASIKAMLDEESVLFWAHRSPTNDLGHSRATWFVSALLAPVEEASYEQVGPPSEAVMRLVRLVGEQEYEAQRADLRATWAREEETRQVAFEEEQARQRALIQAQEGGTAHAE